MKTLVLLRHSKSSHFIENLTDIERPLIERGYTDALMMSDILKKEQIKIGKIISSPAVRAISTALVFAPQLKVKYENVIINDLLYQCGKQKIVELIKAQDNKLNQLMLVGHNPDFEDVVRSLQKSEIEKLSTTGIAIIAFNVTKWSEISKEKGKLVKLLLPQQFRGERIAADEK